MKAISISIIVLINLFHIVVYHVNSESDSCAADLKLDLALPFDTTSLKCISAWDSHNFILRYKEESQKVWSFVLSTPAPDSYTAIGFSSNGQMVGSSAIVGWMSSSGVNIIQYSLEGTSSSQVKPNQGTLSVVNNSAWLFTQSDRFYLFFQLYTNQPESHIIYAVGPSGFTPSNRVDPPLEKHSDMTSTTVNYASGKTCPVGHGFCYQERKCDFRQSYLQEQAIRKAHRRNMLSLGILMIIGAIIARHCKDWDPLWFYVHAAIQSSAFILGIVGVFCGFILKDKVSANVSAHKNLGITILVMGFLQVLAFWVRLDKGSKLRIYWNWYHHNVGRLLIILAIANTFYGIHLGEKGGKWVASYVIVIGILFVVSVLLEVRMYKKSK